MHLDNRRRTNLTPLLGSKSTQAKTNNSNRNIGEVYNYFAELLIDRAIQRLAFVISEPYACST